MATMKIGSVRLSNQLVLAPMLGINCTAFRLMCHEYGAGLVTSGMIHSITLVKGIRNLDTLIDFVNEERPLAVQLIGRDTEIMKESLQYIEPHCDIIDLNFGCPDREILGQKLGAYYSKHPEQMSKIINAVASATNKPVTAKIRIGWDSQSLNHVTSAKIVEDAGAAAVTIHGRTKDQGYAGKANWAAIKQVKEKVNIPVIGNGDVWSAEDAARMIEMTGCDFVMVARGCKGNPYLFKQCDYFLNRKKTIPGQTDKEKGSEILKFIKFYNKVQKIKRFPELRQHAVWLCTAARGSAEKKRQLMMAENENELAEKVKKLFLLFP